MSSHTSIAATIIRAGFAYFGFVFGAGFLLGSIRVPFLVPRFGERIAELIETPFMLVAILMAAHHIGRRYALPTYPVARLGVGFVGLGFLLATEWAFVIGLQRLSIGEYIANKDPVAGAVFLTMMLLFALMPFVLGQIQTIRRRDGD